MNKRTNEELSAEIARRLFGWEPHPVRDYSRPIYASDHNAAHLVVDKMRKRGYLFQLVDLYNDAREVEAGFHRPKGAVIARYKTCARGEEPRAICEAAEAVLDAEEAQK